MVPCSSRLIRLVAILYQDFEFADESKLQMEEDFEIKDHIRTRENSHLQDDLLVFYLSQEDVTVDYDIALFLKYANKRIHCMIPFYSDRIRAQQLFLNDYVYPLIMSLFQAQNNRISINLMIKL